MIRTLSLCVLLAGVALAEDQWIYIPPPNRAIVIVPPETVGRPKDFKHPTIKSPIIFECPGCHCMRSTNILPATIPKCVKCNRPMQDSLWKQINRVPKNSLKMKDMPPKKEKMG